MSLLVQPEYIPKNDSVQFCLDYDSKDEPFFKDIAIRYHENFKDGYRLEETNYEMLCQVHRDMSFDLYVHYWTYETDCIPYNEDYCEPVPSFEFGEIADVIRGDIERNATIIRKEFDKHIIKETDKSLEDIVSNTEKENEIER